MDRWSYPKRRLLPEFDEEAVEPPQSKNKEAAWPDRRTDDRLRAASGAAHKPARDPHKEPHQKDAQSGLSMGQERKL